MNEYRREFRSYSDEAGWTLWQVVKVGVLVMIAGTMVGLAGCAIGLFSGVATNTATVARKEFYPDALLKKYEWFKDAAAALDKKQADIRVYDKRLAALADDYRGVPRSKWPRDDREQSAIWQSELAGVKASYNSLAADYNAQMAKFNWAFTNVGQLPPGATAPLPREFKPYEEN